MNIVVIEGKGVWLPNFCASSYTAHSCPALKQKHTKVKYKMPVSRNCKRSSSNP